MLPFEKLLNLRTNRDLRAVAKAYRVYFNTRRPTDQERDVLLQRLIGGRHLQRIFRRLSSDEQAALKALQARRGRMAAHEFVARFGEIRRYRPWHPDSPRAPWRNPVSIAEKLYYLGFIDIIPGRIDEIAAAQEILSLLPPLPRPQPVAASHRTVGFTPVNLLVDVAMLLGSLLDMDIQPRWDRWIPPRSLRQISRRLTIAENTHRVRSELQTNRLRFVHYLAEVSGLVAVQGGYLKPTVAAWQWLDQSTDQQWQNLWDHWMGDLRQPREPLWAIYRLPDPAPFETIQAQLESLHPVQNYDLPSFLETCRLYDQADGDVLAWLRGPLRWAGLVAVDGDHLRYTPPDDLAHLPPEAAHLEADQDAITLHLPWLPHLRALVEAQAWITVDRAGWRVDETAVRKAVGAGWTSSQIAAVLATLCDQPISGERLAQIETWEAAANGLRLQTVTILTAPDAEQLNQLRQNRHLRRYFVKMLSAHHAVVRTETADELAGRLARRGLPVTDQRVRHEPIGSVTPEMSAYLWVALHVLHRLGDLVPLPFRPPSSLSDWLTDHLPPDHDLRPMVDECIAALHRRIEQRTLPSSPVQSDDPAAIRAAIEAAYQAQQPITIDYFSPTQGHPTRRTIAPITPLTADNGAWYFDAWCHMADAERTFRLDRVLRIIDSPEIKNCPIEESSSSVEHVFSRASSSQIDVPAVMVG